MITRARVLDALATVHDPELDEPITTLGFVGSCDVSDGGDVSVRLRLPTPQCAPKPPPSPMAALISAAV